MSIIKEVKVPDIGGAKQVDVIELLVSIGDQVKVEQSLITLESDKASMEVPSPFAGTVKELKVKVGDKVSEGSLVLTLETNADDAVSATSSSDSPDVSEPMNNTAAALPLPHKTEPHTQVAPLTVSDNNLTPTMTGQAIHAGPGVRRLARELGIDLSQVPASGNKNRVLKTDLQQFVKAALNRTSVTAQSTHGLSLSVAPTPIIDFSQFGEIELKPLNKIKKLTGTHVHRSWVTAPQVTQFNETDITELEAFRQAQKSSAEKRGVKLTPLVFILKAVVAALKQFPQFNASLDASGEHLILKKYFHIGVAVDTPNGLVVPVIRDVDQKGIYDLAEELANISQKAREKGLSLNDMQGGCFTISSLGGIGGTAFTPIVNTPEVAILGVSKSGIKPVYRHSTFEPRLMLPLCLSYDHRVIDGADGARFVVYLSERLEDIRTLLL